MIPETTQDILELLDGCIASAVIGAAMELSLFWLLAEEPMLSVDVARSLSIPLNRCHNWLGILCRLGLLEDTAEGYSPSIFALRAILDALSQDTWAFQAREYRDSSLFVRDLTMNIGEPVSAWQTRELPPQDYFQRIMTDLGFARRFTRKLYEIHVPLAEQLAGMLDLRGVRYLLDLGGG